MVAGYPAPPARQPIGYPISDRFAVESLIDLPGIADRNRVESLIDLPWNQRSKCRGIRTGSLQYTNA